MRRATKMFAGLALLAAMCAATWVDAARRRVGRTDVERANRELVRQLGLTDLSLFTEARYTRHVSQADRHAAFQDGPGAREHFPSGSLVGPGR